MYFCAINVLGLQVKYKIIPCTNNQNAEYLVMSSGLSGYGSFWKPQVEFFKQYFHVFIYDQQGCHLDLAEPLLKEDYAVSDLAQQLFSYLKHAKIYSFHFIGHGLGAFVGVELAKLLLDGQNSMLSLTMINAWSYLDPHTKKCFDTRISLLKNAGIQPYVEAQSLLLYPPAWISKNFEKITQHEVHQVENFPAVHNVLTRLRALMNYQLNPQSIAVLDQIPVHLVANKYDFLVPYHQSKLLKAQLKNATLTELISGGHASTITDTALMNRALFERIKPKKSRTTT